ncbi:MAG: HEAT repeat domain-containing protein [Caldilineaceae bacterium]
MPQEFSAPWLWTLDDYQRFLHHPDQLVRFWAYRHIDDQYPQEANRCIATLIDDTDSLLQFNAIKAMGELGGAENERKLLDLLPKAQGNNRHWAMLSLSRMHSALFLPILLEEVRRIDPRQTQSGFWPVEFSPLQALGEYAAPEARALLWKLAEQYGRDDQFMHYVFAALVQQADAETLPRLVRRLFAIKPQNTQWASPAATALADAVGLERLFGNLAHESDPWEVFGEIEGWSDLTLPLPTALTDAIREYNIAPKHKDDEKLVRLSLVIFEQTANERADDLAGWLAEWQTGRRPVGYRMRALGSWQMLKILNELGVRQLSHHRKIEMRNFGLVLLGQYLLDEQDEQRLATVTDETERRQTLLELLAAPRQNVLATIEQEVAALGPGVIPDLIELIEGENFWPQLRALETLTKIAQAQPGAGDAAIPAIVDLLAEDAGDMMNEACSVALRAIGPAAVEPLAARLPTESDTFEIYATGTLSEIPIQASVDALEKHIASKEALEEWDCENLASLGQLQSLAFLRKYAEGDDPLLASYCYTIGLLHGLQGPEMAAWGKLVEAERVEAAQRQSQLTSNGLNRRLSRPQAAPALTTGNNVERKAKKQKRLQAKATQKAQRKTVKKKKKR